MSTSLEWQSFRLRLESLKETVAEEIRSYPPPIPACDAHYNYLLELRRILPQELARFDHAAKDGLLTIEDFIRRSPCKEAVSKLVPKS